MNAQIGVYPSSKNISNDTIALSGCGFQGHGQGLNACENGLKVIIGVRKAGRAGAKLSKVVGWAFHSQNTRCTPLMMILSGVTWQDPSS
jgi:ketol-acid reductoisomerase